MLGFRDDAILLSGPAGSGLKTGILGDYYEFWWKITSGGPAKQYRFPTAIVDMNAGTGELFIQQTGRTVLGSAGHALQLKYDRGYPAERLKVVLVEENPECFSHLQKVVHRRWPTVPVDEAAGPVERNTCGVYLLNLGLRDALETVERLSLGNSIYFFDPLLHVELETVERVASSRIKRFFQTGTEFIVFLFTSDWFTGRVYGWREPLAALPSTPHENEWTAPERDSVASADFLFGDNDWRENVLAADGRDARQERFIDEYQKRLLKWFRWVLPLPFVPKTGQLYHLMFCSNFEDGIKVTRDFYCDYSGNPRYEPANRDAYENFRALHPETLEGLYGAERPIQWKILWHIIRYCEGGLCDYGCKGIKEKGETDEVKEAMRWLSREGYLGQLLGVPSAWPAIPRYGLFWGKVTQDLGVSPPPVLQPITPELLGKRRRGR